MPKTAMGDEDQPERKPEAAKRNRPPVVDVAPIIALGSAAGDGDEPPAPSPWGALTVAIIDDAMHPPRLDRIPEEERDALADLLAGNGEIQAELAGLGCLPEATADERLQAIAKSDEILISLALIGPVSADASRMIEEYRSFRRLVEILRKEVQDVTVCDPYVALPDLSAHNLVLLDYYLNGPSKGGDLAVTAATTIHKQANRAPDQQIVLMSSLETVRDLRGQFRSETDVTGSAFAFIGKPDLNEQWKVKAHLGMLERARPYAPAFTNYRAQLDEALTKARTELLTLVDDMDIGDYAFLQGRALMKDGHPLGDYVFWLLSSQLMALAFERDEMRERQRALDTLEFVGGPFAATEPSTVVANLLHSALVSRNIGPLGPHPRAKADSPFAQVPRVQLGDVFFNADRTKSVVVMSADCDLAFSPMPEREPDPDTPVMLVPGTPVKLKDAKNSVDEAEANTDGLLHREEVYRIVWVFSKYRSVTLGGLNEWLVAQGYDITNRDRLRPLFGLKLQQEFGAHLMRVGPPVMPPMTTKAVGQVFVYAPDSGENAKQELGDLMMTRFKTQTWLRVTPQTAGILKEHCEDLRFTLEGQRDQAAEKKKQGFQQKIDSIAAAVDDDDFWIKLLDGVELNSPGSVKAIGPLGFVVGEGWSHNKSCVMLAVSEDVLVAKLGPQQSVVALVEVELDTGSVSGAA